MASVKERTPADGSARYDVRYRTPDQKVPTNTFDKLADAKKFAVSIETDKSRGEWLDPHPGRETFDKSEKKKR